MAVDAQPRFGARPCHHSAHYLTPAITLTLIAFEAAPQLQSCVMPHLTACFMPHLKHGIKAECPQLRQRGVLRPGKVRSDQRTERCRRQSAQVAVPVPQLAIQQRRLQRRPVLGEGRQTRSHHRERLPQCSPHVRSMINKVRCAQYPLVNRRLMGKARSELQPQSVC